MFFVCLPAVMPGKYNIPENNECSIVSHILHDKKLKRGNHKFNDFIIRLRNVDTYEDIINEGLTFISNNGCPNLFDSQRFGHNSNLDSLSNWINGNVNLRKSDEKSIVLSSLRAAILNRQLSFRATDNTWKNISR